MNRFTAKFTTENPFFLLFVAYSDIPIWKSNKGGRNLNLALFLLRALLALLLISKFFLLLFTCYKIFVAHLGIFCGTSVEKFWSTSLSKFMSLLALKLKCDIDTCVNFSSRQQRQLKDRWWWFFRMSRVEFHPRFFFFPDPSARIESRADLMGTFKRSFIVPLSRRCSLRHIFGPLTPLVVMGWKTSARTMKAKVDLSNNHIHAPWSSSFRAFFFSFAHTRLSLSRFRSVVDSISRENLIICANSSAKAPQNACYVNDCGGLNLTFTKVIFQLFLNYFRFTMLKKTLFEL